MRREQVEAVAAGLGLLIIVGLVLATAGAIVDQVLRPDRPPSSPWTDGT